MLMGVAVWEAGPPLADSTPWVVNIQHRARMKKAAKGLLGEKLKSPERRPPKKAAASGQKTAAQLISKAELERS